MDGYMKEMEKQYQKKMGNKIKLKIQDGGKESKVVEQDTPLSKEAMEKHKCTICSKKFHLKMQLNHHIKISARRNIVTEKIGGFGLVQ